MFGTGLAVSGMTQPSKVIGFLDVGGQWDPSLLFVMGGAVAVHALAYRWMRRRSAPLFADSLPAASRIDAKLLIGSALFGIGWGLSGYCPGPAVVSLAALAPGAIVFVVTMLLGMFVTAKLDQRGA